MEVLSTDGSSPAVARHFLALLALQYVETIHVLIRTLEERSMKQTLTACAAASRNGSSCIIDLNWIAQQ
jgi:hypothetical protein